MEKAAHILCLIVVMIIIITIFINIIIIIYIITRNWFSTLEKKNAKNSTL